MFVICSWCGTVKHEVDQPVSSSPVSHGICPSCDAKLHMAPPVDLLSFLNTLPAPVFLVDDDGRITTANTTARHALSKELDQIEEELGGDVMECMYAKERGGCGNTVHCKGCTIRNNVNHTFETKQNLYRVPATLNTIVNGSAATIQYLISTEWTEQGVLLKIEDEVGEIPFRHNEMN